jgi:hypothetical protein
MKPEFHPAAEGELAAAVEVGEARASGLGAELLHEVRRVVALLCELPDIGELLDAHHRRFPLKRFPFALMYRVDGSRLLILAIAHRRQRPGYWRERR